jgi:hypothetical protein
MQTQEGTVSPSHIPQPIPVSPFQAFNFGSTPLEYPFTLPVLAGDNHPALPALAVAAGSWVALVVNFASARRLVYMKKIPSMLASRLSLALPTSACLILVQVVFWICHLHDMALPGLYMDAVNPDYLAAQALNPALDNPRHLVPTALFPLLGGLYYGMQHYYLGLPVFALFGTNMLALRIAQGLFGSGILVLLQLVLHRVTGSRWLALAGALGLATELAFVASYRTQMYIVISGSFWLLWAIYLALEPGVTKHIEGATSLGLRLTRVAKSPLFLSGVCSGLAVYSYFVYLFFVPAFVLLGWWHTRSWLAVGRWSLGFIVAMQFYVLGYLSLVVGMGGPTAALAWIVSTAQDLDPMASALSFKERLANAWVMVQITVQNGSNELMIFGTTSPGQWIVWKLRLWVVALLFLVVLNVGKGLGLRQQRLDGQVGLLAWWHVAWLPLVFVAVSTVFGNRLWAHHFSPFVPLMYLTLGMALYYFQQSMALALPRWVWGVFALCLVFGNLQQQSVFFERLETTGGTDRFSNAINRMADDALSLSPEMVHVFPEWGFMYPFAFLTANQRSFVNDMSPETLRRLANEEKVLRLYHWTADDGNNYSDSLQAAGFEVGASGSYSQRNQEIAFYWIEATPPRSQ